MRMTLALLLAMPLLCGAATPAKPADATQTAVLAGGCFWGVEAVFERVRGVRKVVSGYAGGDRKTANYPAVGTGLTGHAESVQITYDPKEVSYAEILRIFFAVAHDPTQLNRQGPDTGPQYRSAIFYANDAERDLARSYIKELDKSGKFRGEIVTRVDPLKGVLSGGELSPGLHREEPEQCLRRVQRPAEDPESQAPVSRVLSRDRPEIERPQPKVHDDAAGTPLLRECGGAPALVREERRHRESARRRLHEEGHRRSEHHLARGRGRGALRRLDRRRPSSHRRRALPDPVHAAKARLALEQHQHPPGRGTHENRSHEGRRAQGLCGEKQGQVRSRVLRTAFGRETLAAGHQAYSGKTPLRGSTTARCRRVIGNSSPIGSSAPGNRRPATSACCKLIDACAQGRRL